MPPESYEANAGLLRSLMSSKGLKPLDVSVEAQVESPEYTLGVASIYRALQGKRISKDTLQSMAFVLLGDDSEWMKLVHQKTQILTIVVEPDNLPDDVQTQQQILHWLGQEFKLEFESFVVEIAGIIGQEPILVSVQRGSLKFGLVVKTEHAMLLIDRFQKTGFRSVPVTDVYIEHQPKSSRRTRFSFIAVALILGALLLGAATLLVNWNDQPAEKIGQPLALVPGQTLVQFDTEPDLIAGCWPDWVREDQNSQLSTISFNGNKDGQLQIVMEDMQPAAGFVASYWGMATDLPQGLADVGIALRFKTNLAENTDADYDGAEAVLLSLVDERECGFEMFINRSQGNMRHAPLTLATRYVHHGEPQLRIVGGTDFVEKEYRINQEVVFYIERYDSNVLFYVATPWAGRRLIQTMETRAFGFPSEVRVSAGGYRHAAFKLTLIDAYVYEPAVAARSSHPANRQQGAGGQ